MKHAFGALTLARQDRVHHFAGWKKGARFDAEHLKQQAALSVGLRTSVADYFWYSFSVLLTLWFEGESPLAVRRRVCSEHHESLGKLRPPR